MASFYSVPEHQTILHDFAATDVGGGRADKSTDTSICLIPSYYYKTA